MTRSHKSNAPEPSLSEAEILLAIQEGAINAKALAAAHIEPMTANEMIDTAQIEKILRYKVQTHQLHESVAVFPFFSINVDESLINVLDDKLRQDRRYKTWLPLSTPLAEISGLKGIALTNRLRAGVNRDQKDAALRDEAIRLLTAQGITKESLLHYFLKAMQDRPDLIGAHFDQAEQWIIPFLMNDHITMAVGQRDRATNTVHLYYYDSKDHDLSDSCRQKLVDFHRHLPYRPAVMYHNCAELDQLDEDEINCGVLSTMRVLDRICAHKNIPASYFKNSPFDMLKFRREMAHWLKDLGSTAPIPEALESVVTPDNIRLRHILSQPLFVPNHDQDDSPSIVFENTLFTRRNMIIASVVTILIVGCFMIPAVIIMMGQSFLESTLALVLGVGASVTLGQMTVNWILNAVGLEGETEAVQRQRTLHGHGDQQHEQDDDDSPVLGGVTPKPFVPQFQQIQMGSQVVEHAQKPPPPTTGSTLSNPPAPPGPGETLVESDETSRNRLV